jgi:hypothetical protein
MFYLEDALPMMSRYAAWIRPGRSVASTSPQELEVFALTLLREMSVKRAGQILSEGDTRM